MRRYQPAITIIPAALLALAAGAASGEETLVWSDEFDGTSINTDNWEHMIGDGSAYGLPSGWGNNELQYYTSRPVNSYVSDGYLHIVAREESYAGFSFTSARLRSLHKQDFRYGRMEGRIKLPSGGGIWPAFWMMPTDSPYGGWAACGEIDIVESINTATTAYGTIHYAGEWPNQQNSGGSYSPGEDLSEDFHVYTLEWEPDHMRWYFDGILYYSVTSATWYSDNAPENDRAPFDWYFHFIMNVAVGGNWPGCTSPSCITATFPQEMVIDWIRVYEYETEQLPFYGNPQIIPGRIDAEDFDFGAEGQAYHDCDFGNNGGAYRPGSDVDIEACSEGGYNVGWMCAGEWLEFAVEVPAAGTYTVEARVASMATGGTFHIEFDGEDKTGAISVPVTGGWQNWVTVSGTADLSAGVQQMRFVNSDNPTDEYNINYFNYVLTYALGDVDRDGDVDLDDHGVFAGCLAGPDEGIPPASCTQEQFERCDFGGDDDVDMDDFITMQDTFAM